MVEEVSFRPATEEDVPALEWLIQLLAEDEKEPNGMKIGQKELLRDGFGGDPCFKVILAELSKPPEPGPELEAESPENPLPLSASMQKDERVVGYALYFFNYSTWEGRGIYLEDLYIRKEYRNQGIGTRLLKEVAKVARDKKCARLIWQVLDWNTKALDLYERIGGICVKEWLTVRMYRQNIVNFANSP